MGTAPALDTTLLVETPEHITFRYQLAGPAQRLGAYLVDLCLRAMMLGVAAILLVLSGGDVEDVVGLQLGILLLFFFLLEWGYYVLFEGLLRGASPGKRAFRLRVVREDGRPAALADSFLRNLLRAADLLPTFYLIGALAMALDARFRRLGDLVAGTIVVYEPRTALAQSRPARQRSSLHLPARPALSRQERFALALYQRRASELNTARRRELAEMWAPALRQRFALPEADALELLDALHEKVTPS